MPDELLARNITIEDFIVDANPEITRIFMATMLEPIARSIYTSSWVIIKNNAELDFLTSDNPYYFLDLPLEANKFPKYIALNPENLLFVVQLEVNMGQNNEQEIDFTNANSGEKRYFEAKEENEVALFNTNTIRNANRYIIMRSACEKLKKLISSNIKTSTKQCTQIHCNRNTEQQPKDIEILAQLFDKSRLIKI